MTTEIRFSLTGGGTSGVVPGLRIAITEHIKSHGFRRDSYGFYQSPDSLDIKSARCMINDLYDIEARFRPASMVAFKLRAPLIDVELKRNKHRSA